MATLPACPVATAATLVTTRVTWASDSAESLSTGFSEGRAALVTVLSRRNPEEKAPFGLCNCTSPKQLVWFNVTVITFYN